MLGLIIMCVPLGIAVGLSVVAITQIEPDGSTDRAEVDSVWHIKEVP
jgi:hypothetical protein